MKYGNVKSETEQEKLTADKNLHLERKDNFFMHVVLSQRNREEREHIEGNLW